ncbi:unnamed protein product [Orchesella dallaii]|uniref:Mitochondrial import receptor subunit TOM70 n=1 Tax=Orchesella dallaii TaxID=48710 RepID=A0ABP1PQP2_9HEXA
MSEQPNPATQEDAQKESSGMPDDVLATITSTLDAINLEGVQDDDTKAFNLYKTEGNTYVKMEKYPEALEKYDQAWNHAKSADDRAMILNNRGVVHEKMGDTEKALEIFEEALKIKPEYVKVLIRRSLVNKKLGKFEEAMDDITEAHSLSLKNSVAVAGLQEASESLIVEYAEAEIKKLESTKPSGFVQDGIVKTFLRGFYCDPISRLWRGLDPFPDQGDAKSGFPAAMTCMRDGKFSEAPAHCTSEIEAADSNYRLEAFLLRGCLNFLCGKKDESLADFDAVIKDANASNEYKSCAHLKKAMLRNLWETAEATAEEFGRAEELWKENADLYYHAAVCLVDKGEPVPALALLEKGMGICSDPKKYPLLHVMGLTIKLSYDACMGDPKPAYEKLKQLANDGVFDGPECYELYAQALLLIDGGEPAAAQFEKAFEVSGGEKLFALKKVMAQTMLTKDHDKTIEALSKFVDDPDVGNAALYHMGELSFMMERHEEGFRHIEKSIEESKSIYDTRIRVMGKIDFKYNVMLTNKLKKHAITFCPQQPKDVALE